MGSGSHLPGAVYDGSDPGTVKALRRSWKALTGWDFGGRKPDRKRLLSPGFLLGKIQPPRQRGPFHASGKPDEALGTGGGFSGGKERQRKASVGKAQQIRLNLNLNLILILILILSVNLSLCCGSSGTGEKEHKKIRGKNLPRRRKRVLTKELGWCTMVVHTVIVCPFMPSPIT